MGNTTSTNGKGKTPERGRNLPAFRANYDVIFRRDTPVEGKNDPPIEKEPKLVIGDTRSTK
jgi:hypothetical protein